MKRHTYWCECSRRAAIISMDGVHTGVFACMNQAEVQAGNGTCLCYDCVVLLSMVPESVILPVVPLGQVGQDEIRSDTLQSLRRSLHDGLRV